MSGQRSTDCALTFDAHGFDARARVDRLDGVLCVAIVATDRQARQPGP
jgi:hypothetical protein